MEVKVCGMRQPENVRSVAELKPDYMGFIFAEKSPRYVAERDETALQDTNTPTRVGVFVNASEAYILERVVAMKLEVIQLHGDEPPSLAAALRSQGLTVWKVFGIGKDDFDFQQLNPYLDHVDAFLFDTKGIARGGNGVAFDWQLLKQYPFTKPFYLSGGVDLSNLGQLQQLTDLPIAGIDINSKFETAPGLKDLEKVAQLMKKMKEKSST